MSGLDPEPSPWVKLIARLVGSVLRPRALPPLDASQLRRILVVRPDDRIGNALLTIPLVRALQAALPAAQVDLLLAARRAPVAEGLPGLRVVRFEKRDVFLHPLRFWRWLRALRSYDAAIDASHWHSFSLTSALLARWASLRFMVTTDRGPARALATHAVPLPAGELPDAEAKLGLLAGLALPLPRGAGALETALGADARDLLQRDQQLAPLGLSPRGYAALNPGARKADHRWPALRFAALAAGLRDRHGVTSLVLWGPGEEQLADEVCAAALGAAQRAPATDLRALAALFRGALLVATNDTGPMHLAVACGAPVLALQLSEDAARWSHPGPRFAGIAARGPESLAAALEAAGRLLALTPRAGSAEVAGGPASQSAGPEAT